MIVLLRALTWTQPGGAVNRYAWKFLGWKQANGQGWKSCGRSDRERFEVALNVATSCSWADKSGPTAMAYKTVSPQQPFEYGSAVRVRIAPNPYALVQGSVCGFTKIEDPEAAQKRGAPIGTVYLLVEDESGAAIEISADHLELI
jgi:hypothetical protein